MELNKIFLIFFTFLLVSFLRAAPVNEDPAAILKSLNSSLNEVDSYDDLISLSDEEKIRFEKMLQDLAVALKESGFTANQKLLNALDDKSLFLKASPEQKQNKENENELKLKVMISAINNYLSKYGDWKTFSMQLTKSKLRKMGLSESQKFHWIADPELGDNPSQRLKVALKKTIQKYNFKLAEQYANKEKKKKSKHTWNLDANKIQFIAGFKLKLMPAKKPSKNPKDVVSQVKPPKNIFLKELATKKKQNITNLKKVEPTRKPSSLKKYSLKDDLKSTQKYLYEMNSHNEFGLDKIPRYFGFKKFLKDELGHELKKDTYFALKEMALTPPYEQVSPQNLRISDSFFSKVYNKIKKEELKKAPLINWYYQRYNLWLKITDLRSKLDRNLTVNR